MSFGCNINEALRRIPALGVVRFGLGFGIWLRVWLVARVLLADG
jgi:hypothetical protein